MGKHFEGQMMMDAQTSEFSIKVLEDLVNERGILLNAIEHLARVIYGDIDYDKVFEEKRTRQITLEQYVEALKNHNNKN